MFSITFFYERETSFMSKEKILKNEETFHNAFLRFSRSSDFKGVL